MWRKPSWLQSARAAGTAVASAIEEEPSLLTFWSRNDLSEFRDLPKRIKYDAFKICEKRTVSLSGCFECDFGAVSPHIARSYSTILSLRDPGLAC